MGGNRLTTHFLNPLAPWGVKQRGGDGATPHFLTPFFKPPPHPTQCAKTQLIMEMQLLRKSAMRKV